mgnify:CR=1 FL=1
MNWLEFWASLVGSLAWPISAFAIAIAFRKQVLSLLERAHEVGFGDWKLKISQDFDDAEEVARTLPPPPETAEQALSEFRRRRFSELVSISPNAAIMEEWREIETRLESMAERLGLDILSRKSPLRIMRALREAPVFPDSIVELIEELRNIRNSAAHSRTVTADDASRFRELSDQVIPFLDPKLLSQN